MNKVAYYKTEISNILYGFDLKKITEIYDEMKIKNDNFNRKKKSLSGIWKNVNIGDLENDIKDLKLMLNHSLDIKQL